MFCVPTEGLVDSLSLANVHAKNTPPTVCTKLMSLATTLVTVKLIGMKCFFREGIWKGILFLLLYYFNPVLKYFKYFYRLNHFQGLKSPTLVKSVLNIVNEWTFKICPDYLCSQILSFMPPLLTISIMHQSI